MKNFRAGGTLLSTCVAVVLMGLWYTLIASLIGALLYLLYLAQRGTAVVLCILICVLYLIFKLRRVVKRVVYLRELGRVCREAGMTLTLTGHPMLNALWRVRAGAELEFRERKAGDTRYRTVKLYFVPCLPRRKKVVLCGDGTATYYTQFSIKGTELFGWSLIWQYCDSPERDGYILLMPAARRVYDGRIHPSTELDNGWAVGGCTVYTGGAFLRYIERIGK